MLCTYFTSYRVVSLRAAWVTFDAPGWLDRDPYGIHTSSLSYNTQMHNHVILRNIDKQQINSKIMSEKETRRAKSGFYQRTWKCKTDIVIRILLQERTMEKELDILLERYMQGKAIRKLALMTLT